MALVPASHLHLSGDGPDLPAWLQGPADNGDLPPLLRSFAEAIGRKQALRLAYALGGTEQHLSAHRINSDKIARIVGEGPARVLGRHVCAASRSARVTIPLGPFGGMAGVRLSVRRLVLEGRTVEDIIAISKTKSVGEMVIRRELTRAGLIPAATAQASGHGFLGGDLNESVILARAIDLAEIVRDGRALPEWLQGPADNADLPNDLREIADLIGRPAALLLSAYFGGARLYFSGEKGPNSRISQIIGIEHARKLCEHFAIGGHGFEIELPIGPLTFNNFRASRMRMFILQGMPRDRIARLVGITRRNVNRAARQLRESGIHVPGTGSFSETSALDHEDLAGTFIAAVNPSAEAP